MKTKLGWFAAAWIGASAAALIAGPAAAADVGVSINVNEPGLFGRLDIGGYPPPQTIYAQPLIIQRQPQYAQEPPLYLHVPPGHARRWSRYCRQYDACGRPVYFVRDDWYRNVYAPRYREFHGRGDGRGPDFDRGRGGPGRDDRGYDRGHGDRGFDRRDDRGDGRRDDRGDGRGDGRGRGDR